MAVFSYLYNSRSVAFYHALPLRREDLFLTNYLSGLSFTVLPALAVFALTLLTELALGDADLRGLLAWLLVQVLANFFFYSFAVFCAMFTGHLAALPVFYGVLNLLAFLMTSLVEAVCDLFLYGFRSFPSPVWSLWITCPRPSSCPMQFPSCPVMTPLCFTSPAWWRSTPPQACSVHRRPANLPVPAHRIRRGRGGGQAGPSPVQIWSGPVRRTHWRNVHL